MHRTGSARSVGNVLRERSPDRCGLGLCLRPCGFKERRPMREPGVQYQVDVCPALRCATESS
jgi:hypothetical protein